MHGRPSSRFETIVLATEALIGLVLARLALPRMTPEAVLRLNAAVASKAARMPRSSGADFEEKVCGHIGFVIPRLALRLPWRADCLVQALAGQRMLLRRGIAGRISVGTTKHSDGTFEAHAWLARDGAVILGGDISRFTLLLDSHAPPFGSP